jgi:hypothetical protein
MKKIYLIAATFFTATTFLFSSSASAQALKINEVDYDQTGTDTSEFIELYVSGSGSINLGTYWLILFNGTSSLPYDTVQLPAVTLSAGSYFVICGSSGAVPNCNMMLPAASNIIQNGSPDAVALYDTTISGLVDVVSYEGSCAGIFVEGTGVPTSESDSTFDYTGMSRFPDGTDSNDNSADFHLACITPGTANTTVDTNCISPLSVATITDSDNGILIYPNPFSTTATIRISDSNSTDYKLVLFDVLGRIAGSIHLQSTSAAIHRGNLESGIYFYELKDGKKIAGKGKLVIQD